MKHLPWIGSMLFGALWLQLGLGSKIIPFLVGYADPFLNGILGAAFALGAFLLGWLIGYGLRKVYQQVRGHP